MWGLLEFLHDELKCTQIHGRIEGWFHIPSVPYGRQQYLHSLINRKVTTLKTYLQFSFVEKCQDPWAAGTVQLNTVMEEGTGQGAEEEGKGKVSLQLQPDHKPLLLAN